MPENIILILQLNETILFNSNLRLVPTILLVMYTIFPTHAAVVRLRSAVYSLYSSHLFS